MHHFNTKTPQITVCCKTSYDIVFILLSVQNSVSFSGFIKIVAKRRQILRPKCTKFDVGWGSAPDPAGGAYSAPQTP